MTPQTITIATISHIEDSLNEALSLEAVARRVGYSSFHLHRVFSQTVGMPMHAYIRRRRLTEAAKRIVLSDDPIMDIAFAAGYESQQSFTMAFKAMYKHPPSQFRRMGRYYPLQLPFHFCSDTSGRASSEGTATLLAQGSDINDWMRLVRLVIDGFPGLDEEEHATTLKRYIAGRSAFIMKDRGEAIGLMMLSPSKSCIDFLGVHPFHRRGNTAAALVTEAIRLMPGKDTISLTTFRKNDAADTGHRRLFESLGFAERDLLIEFGYPTQRMSLPIRRS
ncbi:GNAT family N-acetyltransferase [uncultured Cohaesibacter sp.]|uniref:GNAT family N-acetyltransferase n=1 Tax=uncultured Cohaesibacter sp. TaxID=1002546 RepID=UPI00292CD62A|nr:GNAT family N-acetyltransferase [uncultured Cohaesibacter sp.]